MKFLPGVEFKVTHVYREGNAVTDAISKFQDFDHFIWWDSPPSFILELATGIDLWNIFVLFEPIRGYLVF